MKAFRFAAISAFIGSFALSYPSPGAAALIDRLDASVNATLILMSDVQKFRETVKLRSQLDPLFSGTSVAAKGAAASTDDIVSFLIDEKLIAQQFPVSDAEVEQEINSIQNNNHIDRSQLKAALKEQGFSFDDYFELIRMSASKRNLIDRDIRTKVSISDDDVKNYFYNHYSRSATATMAYKIDIISVSTRSYKSAAAARDVAQKALKELQAGESFEEAAKRFSDDASASEGGHLGELTEDQMSPEIREQVKKLQIGQVSPVFSAKNGYYILKLIDMRAGDSDRFEKMKEEIRSQLVAAEYQHQIQLWLERQRQTAFIHRAGEPAVAGLPVAPRS